MIEQWFAALEATAMASGLRGSVWMYPLVNTGHILGVALLVGAIVPLDLRLLGFWPSVPLKPLWQVLTRTAGVGLALAVVCGALLFTARAAEYANSSLFISKMVVVVLGTANALVLHATRGDDARLTRLPNSALPLHVRIAALLSLTAWLTVLLLGRLVGYA